MRRYPLSFRCQAYNEANFYRATPLARKMVAPGDTISSFIVDARFISAVFDKVRTNPLLAQIWLFYVPHRLVWDQWVDFIALSDTVTAVPTTTSAWGSMFETPATAKSVLFRRSYKLAYNQFFGDKQVGQAAGAWYDDITADTVTTLGGLLAWDQLVASQVSRAAYTQTSFTAAVSGATATIPLDDFARSLRDNTARRRQKITGDKYVDVMRQMGVELDWRVQMAPEFLGSGQAVLFPRERAGAGDATSLSSRVSEWSGKLAVSMSGKRHFAEHGYVMALAGFRPSYLVADSMPADAVRTGKDGFFRPDADTVADALTIGNLWRERYGHYLKGGNVIGVNANGDALTVQAGSAPFYPDPASYVVSVGSGPSHMAMTADISIRGLTPVPSARA